MKAKNKMPHIYAIPNDVYFDEKSKKYYPIWNDEQIEILNDGVVFDTVPQKVLKEIYNRNKGAKQPMAEKKQKPSFDGMNINTNMQYDVMEQFKNVQSQEQTNVVASANDDKIKIDNTGSIKITCTLEQQKILKMFASITNESQKTIVLDALQLYYEQPQNKETYEQAKQIIKAKTIIL